MLTKPMRIAAVAGLAIAMSLAAPAQTFTPLGSGVAYAEEEEPEDIPACDADDPDFGTNCEEGRTRRTPSATPSWTPARSPATSSPPATSNSPRSRPPRSPATRPVWSTRTGIWPVRRTWADG